jgi:lipid-binding SYLF domain-containing protein
MMSRVQARWGIGGVVALLLATGCASGGSSTAASDPAVKNDAQALVERSRMTLETFLADPDMGPPLRNLMKNAHAVLIYPRVLRGAFVVGASGGSGVLLVKDPPTGTWTGPAFYTIGEASFGLQAGGDAQEVVLVVLSERGIRELLSRSVKLGAGTSVAAGPVGAGAEAATQNLSADIVSYARSKGLYAGVSLEGAVVEPRDSLNAAYYGQPVNPTDILIRKTASNPQAGPLRNSVAAVTR